MSAEPPATASISAVIPCSAPRRTTGSLTLAPRTNHAQVASGSPCFTAVMKHRHTRFL
jgi:hypothetical protein